MVFQSSIIISFPWKQKKKANYEIWNKTLYHIYNFTKHEYTYIAFTSPAKNEI